MTHDEIIKVIQAHKDNKPLQTLTYNGWADLIDEPLNVIFDIISDRETIRVKPEPEYIPWTADDWREFQNITFKKKGTGDIKYHINTWNGTYLIYSNYPRKYMQECEISDSFTYNEFFKTSYNSETNTPCGKLVEK